MLYMGSTSVAETYNFIKQFHFKPGQGVDIYNSVTFSDSTKIRLSPPDGLIKLKRNATTQWYPTDVNIWARTWTTTPLAMRKMKMVQIFPNLQPDNTNIKLRIYNGTSDYYWDGADWVVAGASNWNTEAEINAHIATFNVLPARQFAITLNLSTTDNEVTPVVEEIRVLIEVQIDYIEDIVLRSLMPTIEAAINPTANLTQIPAFTAATSSITLNTYRSNIPYTISNVIGVYDLTADINLLYNLFSSYDSGTTVITLSSPLPKDHRPLIVIRYTPELVFIQHQDWYEVSKVPCLLIQQLEVPFTSSYNRNAREGIVDKGTGAAVVVREPWRVTFEFRIHGLTASVVDEMRLMSRVIQFFEENQMLRSTGLDEYYRMRIEREFRDLSSPNHADKRAFWTRFTVSDIRMPMVSETAYAVQKLSMTYSEPRPPHEDPIKGGARVIETVHTEDGQITFAETVDVT